MLYKILTILMLAALSLGFTSSANATLWEGSITIEVDSVEPDGYWPTIRQHLDNNYNSTGVTYVVALVIIVDNPWPIPNIMVPGTFSYVKQPGQSWADVLPNAASGNSGNNGSGGTGGGGGGGGWWGGPGGGWGGGVGGGGGGGGGGSTTCHDDPETGHYVCTLN